MEHSVSDHGMQARTASGINALLGLYLIASPWIWAYAANGAALWNSIAAGIVVGFFGAARVRDPHHASSLSVINVFLGAWTIASPWIFAYAANGPAQWNSIILGAIVLVLAIWSGAATATEHPVAAGHA